ncbi:MAG: MoxR family ATPase [Lentisphaeria bacterium]|jgi:MoxR-like ATPase|nr:MoxR family ATPase [Lentisphaeria bacterium]MDP7743721.1 MoxR family ATPase [Lentisphaeria bacterium]
MPQADLDNVRSLLESQGYITDENIVMSTYLAMALQKPLLLEGPTGVGKTEVAKAMAKALGTELIRLQCYEGLDANAALYEWNYQRQLLHLRLEEGAARSIEEKEATIFGEAFLLKRPLLQALTCDKAPVLLIDELDRSDEEFESFLLEILSDWQITVPEIGTITASQIPSVVITSNRTRELSDAVRRRCLYLWIGYPSFEKELAIVRGKVQGVDEKLADQICHFMQRLRELQLEKTPGIAETIDWAMALVALHRSKLDPDTVRDTLGVICKNRDDMDLVANKFLPTVADLVAD